MSEPSKVRTVRLLLVNDEADIPAGSVGTVTLGAYIDPMDSTIAVMFDGRDERATVTRCNTRRVR